MEEGRTFVLQKTSRVVLDSRFSITKGLVVGDEGQARVEVRVIGERLEVMQDDVEHMIKTLRISKIEKIDTRGARV